MNNPAAVYERIGERWSSPVSKIGFYSFHLNRDSAMIKYYTKRTLKPCSGGMLEET